VNGTPNFNGNITGWYKNRFSFLFQPIALRNYKNYCGDRHRKNRKSVTNTMFLFVKNAGNVTWPGA